MTNPVQYSDNQATPLKTGSTSTVVGTSTAIPAAFDARKVVFQQLKPYTSQLLQLRDSPARLQTLLQRLEAAIKDADPAGLNSNGCMDYILFPLMFGVDSIAVTRRPGQPLCECLCRVSCCRSH